MSQEVTYKSGLYAINTEIDGKAYYRKEVFVGPIRYYMTKLWWDLTWKPYRVMEINNSKILYERHTG